jgi:hypothetical protein
MRLGVGKKIQGLRFWKRKPLAKERPGHALIAAEFQDFLKEDSGDFTPRRRARTLLHEIAAQRLCRRELSNDRTYASRILVLHTPAHSSPRGAEAFFASGSEPKNWERSTAQAQLKS